MVYVMSEEERGAPGDSKRGRFISGLLFIAMIGGELSVDLLDRIVNPDLRKRVLPYQAQFDFAHKRPQLRFQNS